MHLFGAKVVAGGRVLDPGYVTVSDDRIVDVGHGRPRDLGGGPHLDLDGSWLLPGYIDLHVHGGGGGSFTGSDQDEHLTATRFHSQHGTTSLLATTVSSSREHLRRAVTALRETMRGQTQGSRILGINLEGPYISQECRGAQDPAGIRDPDIEEFSDLLTAGDGAVRVVTLAPERPGARSLAAAAREAGVVVSLGHAAATYEDVLSAVAGGATLVTHMFNGMHQLHQRVPGLVGAALVSPELSCELVADGMHVHPAVVRMLIAAKGVDRVLLITDAINAAGLPDGNHVLGDGVTITVMSGRVTVQGTQTLAGSTLTMEQAVKNVVAFADLSVVKASQLASTNAARLLGRSDTTGEIRSGHLADLVVLNSELDVCATLVGGNWAYRDGHVV
jgi:N-acetylglucosamine-6-phosphate deacetylase